MQQVCCESAREPQTSAEVAAVDRQRHKLEAQREAGRITAFKLYGVSEDGAEVVYTRDPSFLPQPNVLTRPGINAG